VKIKPKNSTEERIVEAAALLFSRQGFTASSTSEIARLAGVSEVTIFRHFPRKRDLFWAATESRLRRLRISKELRSQLEANEDPKIVLPAIVELLVQVVQNEPEMLRLLYLSLFELGDGAERILRKHLAQVFEPLQRYFARCVSQGSIRDLEPGVTTLGLAASVAAHQNLQQLLALDQIVYSSMESAVAAYSQFWMKALLPDVTAAAPLLTAGQVES
jgi:AcrR family transcriptional regulator